MNLGWAHALDATARGQTPQGLLCAKFVGLKPFSDDTHTRTEKHIGTFADKDDVQLLSNLCAIQAL